MSSKGLNQVGAIEPQASKPWYKERWPWFLMAGPAIVVVACIITIYLAFTQDRDIPLVNKQNRQGLKIDRSADAEAPRFLPPVDRPIPEHLRSQFEK
ncbi:FixH family protein [Oligella sp. HMSC05A10]|uniref:FixH family protein n=1 Tax=Oligella sp. HMSC05A10 TaxID=1581112 RepID=UPI0008A55126|nr:FixH family protein [Oligella sp. HMSC05A10]